MSGDGEIRLTARASRLAGKGRPWFYADDLGAVAAETGRIVRVRGDAGRDFGLGFYAGTSRLQLRLCGPWPGDEVPTAEEFFAQRLAGAIARRADMLAAKAGVRLVHSETDGVPGLVVDRYADCLVVQVTSAVVENHLDALVPELARSLEPRMVLARNDVAARRLEGLPEEVRLLHGRRVDEVVIEEHGIAHPVRLFDGQKTGFYLDQRPARALVRKIARGRRVLDAFSYQGAFSLAALAGGAVSALALDQSQAALARAVAAAERNSLQGLEIRRCNGFSAMRELRAAGARYDLVVVDPPAFAKSRREVDGALRGYRDLNRLAMRLLAPGGWLLTCSCSHHLTRPMFEDVLRQAAADLPFRLMLHRRMAAGDDHPVWIGLPESEYLKVHLLRRTDLFEDPK